MAKRLNLVTGCFGFSGMYLVRELLAAGQKVVATDLRSAIEGEPRQIAQAIGFDSRHPKLELVAADLLEPDSLEALLSRPITHLFHTASLYDYSADLDTLRRINVEGTRNLLRAVRGKALRRFFHWSTCGVFGKPWSAEYGRKVNIPFSESSSSPKNTPEDATGPDGTHLVNDYSITKWEQEKMMWAAQRRHGLPLTVIRPAPIYGPGSAYGHGGIVLAVAHGLVPVLPGDADKFITISVHAQDVARFAAFIADKDETIGEDYNVVDNSIISYAEFMTYIGLLVGRRMPRVPWIRLQLLRPFAVAAATAWTWAERRFGVPRPRVFEVQSATYMSSSYWVSNRKSLATGFRYRYPDVREGLKDTVAWFREMGWLTDRKRLLGRK